MLMATSTRSLIIWSTSFPWNPTSVNFVASTFINGASESFAILRAISVLPHPNWTDNKLVLWCPLHILSHFLQVASRQQIWFMMYCKSIVEGAIQHTCRTNHENVLWDHLKKKYNVHSFSKLLLVSLSNDFHAVKQKQVSVWQYWGPKDLNNSGTILPLKIHLQMQG